MIKFYLSQGQIGTPPLFIWIFYDFRDATLNGHLFSRNKTILLFYSWNKLSFCVKMQVQNMYVVILWICSVFAKGHTTIIIVTTWNMTQTKSSVAKHFFFTVETWKFVHMNMNQNLVASMKRMCEFSLLSRKKDNDA